MKFLVDVNLPKNFSFFNSAEFQHVTDIDPKMHDKSIWEYAKTYDFIILTKDADFYHRSMLDDAGPTVVYLKLGNRTLRELHTYFTLFWPLIISNLPDARIITVYPDKIEIIR